MSRFILTLILCLHMMGPITAMAQSALKTPLSYSLKEYGLVLATALLGGLASWWMKVRSGEIPMWSPSALIGELSVSAFAGLIAFWLCEYMNFHPLLSAAVVGMAGHAGARGLTWLEIVGKRRIEKTLGIDRQPKDLP